MLKQVQTKKFSNTKPSLRNSVCFVFSVLSLLISITSFSQNIQRSLNTSKWEFHKKNEPKWYPATVPGTVHTDLYANKLIPDPFFADNEKQLQWIENEDWEYKTNFIVSKKEFTNSHIEIEFEGLDTYAKVYLNDSLIISADNMFRNWNTDIKKYVRIGKNNLRIVFESAVKKGKEEAKKLTYTLPGDEKVFTRKAQYQYGWDWGPRFVTCGIWKNVNLIFWNAVKIRNVNCIQKTLTDSLAELSFVYEVDCEKEGVYDAVVYQPEKRTESGIYPSTHNSLIKKGKQIVTVEYYIKNPKRWWSNGLGEAHLYNFTIALSKKSGPIDQLNMNVGLRTIELIQEKDTVGSSFYFKLNGVPVFMKGANYIPPDNFLPRKTQDDYEDIVNNAAFANMNMLRVWGGGVYADEKFYDLCDSKGILVWQDLMFACAMYPGDQKFISNVKQEVIDNVNRLKNHPCIALWCGNNESDEGWKNWDWQKQYKYSKSDSTKIWNDYTNLFHNVIPNTLDSISPKTIYWPSSPSIGWGKKESLLQGDSHYWGIWWGMEPFEVYNTKVGRFMSEYGFQSMPELSTLKKIAAEKDLNFNSEAIKNHQKHKTGYETINTYMERDYKVPTNFEDYIYVSQLLQARGMKTAIEAHRRNKPYCMGTLYWQLNDCWPVTSWSSIDYYGNWKAAQYEVKRLYENVILSIEEKNDSIYVHAINDREIEIEGLIALCRLYFNGIDDIVGGDWIKAPAHSNSIVLKYPKVEVIGKADPKNYELNAILKTASERFTGTFLFEKPKNLKLFDPKISIMLVDQNTIDISTELPAKSVFLSLPDATFGDNYFDLSKGEIKRIKIITSSKTDLSKLTIKSLYDVN